MCCEYGAIPRELRLFRESGSLGNWEGETLRGEFSFFSHMSQKTYKYLHLSGDRCMLFVFAANDSFKTVVFLCAKMRNNTEKKKTIAEEALK